MRTGYKVVDVMTKKPITVSPGISLIEAATVMRDNHIGGLLITEGDQLKGVISEQDITRNAVAEGLDLKKTTVDELMVKKLHTISEDEDIYFALLEMRDLNIRHLPVVEDDKLVGLLTLKDVLKIQPQMFDLMVEKIELREEENKPIFRRRETEGNCQLCGNYAEKLFEVEGSMVCQGCKKDIS